SEEAWRRENARLRNQLAASSKRESVQAQQIQSYEDQLAKCKQEMEQLRASAAADSSSTNHTANSSRPPEAIMSAAVDGDGVSAREHEMLRLIMELIGTDTVRVLLAENPRATPAELREQLVQFHHREQQHHQEQRSPVSRRSASDKSSSPVPPPLRGTRASTKTLPLPQPHLVLDGSSPALDAIYEK
uniref:Uncharacterized protein n=1 Tax=Globisporangium ultimum (strain ATCC 200006 / CBS 805.95 / DAOM BR144) TaxID=431595 RepID=K3W8D2_GLOUD